MSLKKFSPPFFGKMKSAEQIESAHSALWSDYQEFLKIEASDELKEFKQLEQFVNSGEFAKLRTEIKSLKFEGSQEFNQLREFRKLKKLKTIMTCLAVSESADFKRFRSLKTSDKLKEFYSLEEYVNEGQFEKEKKEVLGQVFKGSVEERHLIDFRKLQKDKGIRAWLEIHNSAELKNHTAFSKSEKLKLYTDLKNSSEKDKKKKEEFRKLEKDQEIRKYFLFEKSKKFRLYHETSKSHLLGRYEELKKFTESETFLIRKKFLEDTTKFQKSEAFQKFNKFKALNNDPDIRFFRKFEKSSPLKIYLDTIDSFELKRYYELEKITASKEFLERKAYLDDKGKWEKTKEYAMEQKYLSMKKLPHLVKYFGYQGSSAFDFFRTWEVSFEDRFRNNQVDASKWITKSLWAHKLLGKNFSRLGDLQCFTDGKNAKTGDKGLSISVRKEKADGLIWKPDAGFVPAAFDYTSGILSTGESFLQKEGIFEVKVKFNPVKEVVSSIALIGENGQPQVSIMEQGVKNWAGIMTTGKDKPADFNGAAFDKLKKGLSYIFRVHWENNQFRWLVNEKEMMVLPAGQFSSPVHLNIASLVVFDIPESRFPVNFEVEWVRCFRKKKQG